MAYIPPNSDIVLLRGVPIDATHDHTLWFANATQQMQYFYSKRRVELHANSYVRKGKGVIKAQVAADSVYDCNYLMYRNTSYSTKWFYAFCTIEYINDNTSQINFEIDNLQTWFFEMQLAQCYVEREHTLTDVAGDNLIPEGLETGEYVYKDADLEYSHLFLSYDVLVLSTFHADYNMNTGWTFTDAQGEYRWGIYTGLNIRTFRGVENAATVTLLNSFFSAVNNTFGENNGIVAVVMIPNEALDANLDPQEIRHDVPRITNLQGYYPKNQKLLTAPYCYVEGQNCEGATAIFPQEYFGYNSLAPGYLTFMITFNISAAPVAICVPLLYRGSDYNYMEALYINNFTQCSYNTDLFKAYMAQSLTAKIGQSFVDTIMGITQTYNMVKSKDVGGLIDKFVDTAVSLDKYVKNADNVVSSVEGLITSRGGQNIIGGLALAAGGDTYASIYSDLSQAYAKSVAAPHNTGSNTPDYLTSHRLKGFWFVHRTIRYEFAEIIDHYFDRFGYACHKTKVPNIHARQKWTYTKTVGCQVSGNIPADAIVDIQNIFNSGITFWADYEHFGDYSLTNGLLS